MSGGIMKLKLKAHNFKLVFCAGIFLVFSSWMLGCTQLKERFGTTEETPELAMDREKCQKEADRIASDSTANAIKRMDIRREAYNDCMNKKGHNKSVTK